MLLEKEHHPRFHIGESLLPANLPIFARLGVLDEVKAIGMQKWGAEFISPWDGRHQTFEFSDGWNKSLPFAYQVRRSQLDEILFRRAAHVGAQAIEGCRVREVEFLEDGAGARVHAAFADGRRESCRRAFSSTRQDATLFSVTARGPSDAITSTAARRCTDIL